MRIYNFTKKENILKSKLFIKKTSKNIEEIDPVTKFTPLCNAINFNDEIAIARLIKKADINNNKSKEGLTALGLSIKKGHIRLIKKLLVKGADVNLISQGTTPLILAIEWALYIDEDEYKIYNCEKMLTLLIYNGAKVNHGTSGHKAIDRLLELGLKRDLKDKRSRVIVKKIIKLLISNDALLDDMSKEMIKKFLPKNNEADIYIKFQYKKTVTSFLQTSRDIYKIFDEMHKGGDYITNYILGFLKPSYLNEKEKTEVIDENRKSFSEKIKRNKKFGQCQIM